MEVATTLIAPDPRWEGVVRDLWRKFFRAGHLTVIAFNALFEDAVNDVPTLISDRSIWVENRKNLPMFNNFK